MFLNKLTWFIILLNQIKIVEHKPHDNRLFWLSMNIHGFMFAQKKHASFIRIFYILYIIIICSSFYNPTHYFYINFQTKRLQQTNRLSNIKQLILMINFNSKFIKKFIKIYFLDQQEPINCYQVLLLILFFWIIYAHFALTHC